MRCGMTRNPVCEAAGPLGRDGDDGHGVGVAEAVEDVHQLSIGRAGSIHDVPERRCLLGRRLQTSRCRNRPGSLRSRPAEFETVTEGLPCDAVCCRHSTPLQLHPHCRAVSHHRSNNLHLGRPLLVRAATFGVRVWIKKMRRLLGCNAVFSRLCPY